MNALENKEQRRPVIDPLLLILKSRRVIVALMALLVGVLTLVVPEMDAVRGELLTLLITLSLAVIGGYSVEDAARTARSTVPGLTETDLRRLLRDVVIEVLDEMLPVGE